MDVQIVAGLAPGAAIVVYFSSFDEQGWVDLLNEVIAGKPASAVSLSVSWGLAEDDPDWSKARAAGDRRAPAGAPPRSASRSVPQPATTAPPTRRTTAARTSTSRPRARTCSPSAGRCSTAQTDVIWWQSPGERTEQRRRRHRRRRQRRVPAPELAGRQRHLAQPGQHRRPRDPGHRRARRAAVL